MADLTFNELMTAHMDAVRAKSGVTGKLSIAAATEAVNSITVGGAGDSTVKFGYWTADGQFQEVDLSGDSPVDSGEPIAVNAVMFNTGKEAPDYGGGSAIEFYECASYTPNVEAHTRYIMTLSGAADEKANGTYVRTKWVDPPPEEWTEDPIAIWENENGYRIEEFYYSEFNYTFYNASGESFCYSNEPYYTRVTDYSSIVWWNNDIGSDVYYSFSAWQTEEVPATTEGWAGCKVTQDAETGLWSRTGEYKENMPAPFFTPQVGMIYSEDTSIACSGMFSEADTHLVALFHFDEDANDTTGNVATTLTEKSIEQNGKFDGCLYGDTYNANIADSSYYMEIIGLPELDAFTIEWLQYDEDNYGDGGAFLWQPATDELARSTFASVGITKDDPRYISGKWKHIAFVREAGSSVVTQYINGKSVGTVDFSDKIGGRPINFVGLAPSTGQAKTVRIDELAFYNAAKYTADFAPRNIPIIK